VTDDAWRRSLKLVEERCHGIDVLAVRYHLALELDAGICTQRPFEVVTQHLLALCTVPDAHGHIRHIRRRVIYDCDQYQRRGQEGDFLGRSVHHLSFSLKNK